MLAAPKEHAYVRVYKKGRKGECHREERRRLINLAKGAGG